MVGVDVAGGRNRGGLWQYVGPWWSRVELRRGRWCGVLEAGGWQKLGCRR
jgi:hypothetical protein